MHHRKGLKFIFLAVTLAVLLCLPALSGTTYATSVNSISTDGAQFRFSRLSYVAGSTEPVVSEIVDNSTTPIFSHNQWEPGYTLVEYFKLTSDPDTSFQFSFQITSDKDNLTELADVIDVYYIVQDGSLGTDRATALSRMDYVGTLREVMDDRTLITAAGDGTVEFAVALQMRQSAGNSYQGLSLFGVNGQPSQFHVALTASASTGS